MKLKIVITIIFYLVLSFTNSFAQSNLSKISGSLETSPYSYAYLFLSERNLTIKKPIINGKFNFLVNKEKEFEMAILYFGLDSNRTYSDIVENRNKGIFESKIIALDDSISIYVKDNVKDSQVLGGIHTKALYAMDDATKTGNYKNFFEEYSKSPLALMLLSVIIRVDKRTYRSSVDYKKIYNNLPINLQNSKKGQEVKALIEKN
ncbi:hypothetical protein FA048_05780 [Pedobacter polaris]|uniref:DUF4369 domain-containing protein n=1 Tax=Pedobacter polaris TaxID=2571273 RepID=A0A4U1CV69_9SPHI|nr:hypothetical protein [Pedobacter polaris]TKC13121.1 hypothetical protein FA048_05780 [Pedobacter polaris]